MGGLGGGGDGGQQGGGQHLDILIGGNLIGGGLQHLTIL
jgi:hypothetical protein